MLGIVPSEELGGSTMVGLPFIAIAENQKDWPCDGMPDGATET